MYGRKRETSNGASMQNSRYGGKDAVGDNTVGNRDANGGPRAGIVGVGRGGSVEMKHEIE